MGYDRLGRDGGGWSEESGRRGGAAPGKVARTDALRKKASRSGGSDDTSIAREGFSGAASDYPHRDTIERSFGMPLPATSYADEVAGRSSQALGADAYALGNQVAFATPTPSLHVAAHEAAHVMQATGNVHMHGGGTYDDYEAHADAVADKVVRGESALDFLIGPSPAAAAAPAEVRKHESPTIARAPEVEEELSDEEHEEAAAEGAVQSEEEEDEEEAEGAKQDEGDAEGQKQAVAGHKTNGGTFAFTKYDAHDGDPGNDTKKSCGIDLTITFTPNEKLRSKKISFVQIMKAEKGGTPYLFPNEKPRATTAKDGDEGWAVDRVAGQKNADYQIGNDGKEVPGWGQIGHRKSKADFRDATLEDTVRLPRDAGQTFKVQATSFTLDKSHGKYLGGVSWGYEVDAAGKVTKAAEAIQSMGAPGGIQKKALKRWNQQAKLKDKSKRNHKNQKKITVP